MTESRPLLTLFPPSFASYFSPFASYPLSLTSCFSHFLPSLDGMGCPAFLPSLDGMGCPAFLPSLDGRGCPAFFPSLDGRGLRGG